MPETRPELGQFFTPRPVIDAALQMLADCGAELVGARVCDPACGPGEWLLRTLEAGAGEALGLDCDPAMIPCWRDNGLARDSRCRLAVADALSPSLRLAESADLVLGNPPFGAELTDLRGEELVELARHYRLSRQNTQPALFSVPSTAEIDRMRRFPTELLFLERFVEICRPDGWIAIILPQGVFSNRRWLHVREWLLREFTVHVVADLPRATFRAHATTARTCLMLMHKRHPPADHQVALAQIDDCSLSTLMRMRAGVSGTDPVEDDLALTPPIFGD